MKHFICIIIIFNTSCSLLISNKKFSTYKINPFKEAVITPSITGYYFYKSDSIAGMIFLFDDGKCCFDYEMAPYHFDSLANRSIKLINESVFWKIEYWGHYVIKDNVISIEFYKHNAQTYRWNIIKSNGVLIDKETLLINEIFCDWQNPTCKLFGHKLYSPPLEFKFHPYNFQMANPFFVKKRWYQKKVWYNQE